MQSVCVLHGVKGVPSPTFTSHPTLYGDCCHLSLWWSFGFVICEVLLNFTNEESVVSSQLTFHCARVNQHGLIFDYSKRQPQPIVHD